MGEDEVFVVWGHIVNCTSQPMALAVPIKNPYQKSQTKRKESLLAGILLGRGGARRNQDGSHRGRIR